MTELSSIPVLLKLKQQLSNLFQDTTRSERETLDFETSVAQIKNKLIYGSDETRCHAIGLALTHLSARHCQLLFPEVIKLISTTNTHLKLLCYNYVIVNCQKQSSADMSTLLHAVNSLQKDTKNMNHIIRGWALHVLSSLALEDVTPMLLASLQGGVADSSPWVRLNTVYACPKLAEKDSSLIGVLCSTVLLRLLDDIELFIVGAACQALVEICWLVPDLLTVDSSRLSACYSTFQLNDLRVLADKPQLQPFLGCLHWHVCPLISQLPKLHPLHQSSAILLLLTYFRTFLRSDLSGSSDCESFVSTMFALTHSSSPSVSLLSVSAILLLKPGLVDSESWSGIISCLLHQWYTLDKASDVVHRLTILELIYLLTADRVDLKKAVAHIMKLSFRDPIVVWNSKLKFWVKFVQQSSDAPIMELLNEFLAALHWDWVYKDEDKLEYQSLLFNAILLVLQSLFKKKIPIESKDIQNWLSHLVHLMLYSTSSSAQDGVLRVLSALLSQSLVQIPVETLNSTLECIASELCSAIENVNDESGKVLYVNHYSSGESFNKHNEHSLCQKSQAAIISLLTEYHHVSVFVTLDLFTLLVSKITQMHMDIQLEVLHMGIILCACLLPQHQNTITSQKPNSAAFQFSMTATSETPTQSSEMNVDESDVKRLYDIWLYMLYSLIESDKVELCVHSVARCLLYLCLCQYNRFRVLIDYCLAQSKANAEARLWNQFDCFSTESADALQVHTFSLAIDCTQQSPKSITWFLPEFIGQTFEEKSERYCALDLDRKRPPIQKISELNTIALTKKKVDLVIPSQYEDFEAWLNERLDGDNLPSLTLSNNSVGAPQDSSSAPDNSELTIRGTIVRGLAESESETDEFTDCDLYEDVTESCQHDNDSDWDTIERLEKLEFFSEKK